MRLEDLLPEFGMPRTQYPPDRDERWNGGDNLTAYRQSGGHPLYGESDIVYHYNSNGFRSPEFNIDAQLRVISIGCSWTFGVGLPQHAIFHELFAAKLRQELKRTVVNWNLALGGTGSDYAARVLHIAVPLLDPDVVLILFSGLGRREYMTAYDRYINYVPNYVPWHGRKDTVWRDVCSHFSALTSTLDDQLHLFRNYKSIETLLRDRCWLFSFLNTEEAAGVEEHLDTSRQVRWGRVVDKARDHIHPGPRTHEAIFRSYWDRFVDIGGPDLLVCR